MSVPDALAARLRAAGCVFAEDEAAHLLAAAEGPALEALVARRVAGEPLEQVLGWATFDGTRVELLPGVFVPRQRSALLVREAARLLPTEVPALVVDLCCGSGALGLAVSRRRPRVVVHAADVDPVAVRCARLNLEPAGHTVHEGDLFHALPPALLGRVDVLVVNAPYVPTDRIALMPPEARDHEPAVALDGGADGVLVHRAVAAGCVPWLAPGGAVLVETSRAQSARTAEAFAAVGLEVAELHDDELAATAVRATRS